MDSRCQYEFGINAFDCTIGIECGTSEIRDTLDRYLLPPLPRSPSIPSDPDIRLSVECIDSDFRVSLDGKTVASADNLHNAARAAIKALDDALVQRIKGLRAVHAGAVLIDGRAVLLPGSTHAGKSSLVAELLQRGARHFSDEYALIDDRGLVHSYPRPLLLRKGSIVQSIVLPEELNSGFATAPAPVGWILAIDYVPEAAWDIREISHAEAVMLLLRNTPHEMAQSPEMIDFFLRVAASAACCEGTRGDAAEAATRILDLVRQK